MRGIVAVLFLGVLSVSLAAELYKLQSVRRMDQDLYRTIDKIFIETRYCYHYTYGEDAVLKWDGDYSYSNKIIWQDGSNCDVKKVFK
jgi:hypothetical protein